MIKKENVSEAEWKKLSEEELNSVDGGVIKIVDVPLKRGTSGTLVYRTMYKVYSAKGTFLSQSATLDGAISMAESWGVSTEVIDNRDQQ